MLVVSCCTHEIPCGLLRADEVVCCADWMIQVDVGLENLPGMQSFDLDFPSGLNSYITAPQLGDYMIQYVDHFNLRRFFRRSVNSVNPHFYESFYRNKDDTRWYSMIIWINVDYPMIFYDLWYPMILGSILAKFYSHQPSYNRSMNHVRLQVTPFWLGYTVQRLMMLDAVSKT